MSRPTLAEALFEEMRHHLDREGERPEIRTRDGWMDVDVWAERAALAWFRDLLADPETREKTYAAISDAYYEARNCGGTMTQASENATKDSLAAIADLIGEA